MPRRPLPPADPLRRALAAFCAALVLTLTIFAASPVAHRWLHSDHHAATETAANNEHDCAVVLFASGVSLAAGPIAIAPPTVVTAGISPVTAAEVFLVSPRYLRQPERGPPSLG